MTAFDPLKRTTEGPPKSGDQVVVKMWVVETEGDMCRVEPLDGIGTAWVPTAYLLRDPGSLAPLEPRFNGFFDCPNQRLKEIVNDHAQWPWPRRLAAGRALLDRQETDKWAHEAYIGLSCDDVAELRVVGLRGLALDRSVEGFVNVVDTLRTEITHARPTAQVAITALRAIEEYPITMWHEPHLELGPVLAVWERCEHTEIRNLAARLLARLDSDAGTTPTAPSASPPGEFGDDL